MSAFGTIRSLEMFRESLARGLRYAESDRFWFKPLQELVARDLRLIEALVSDGRTPLLSERLALTLDWSVGRAREPLRDTEPSDWLEEIESIASVGSFFTSFPSTTAEIEAGRYSPPRVMARVPLGDELLAAAATLEGALLNAGENRPRPPESAFASREPMFADTMPLLTWLQWVLVPNLRMAAAHSERVPKSSQLCALTTELAHDRRLWGVLHAVGAIDELFIQRDAELEDSFSRLREKMRLSREANRKG